MGTKNKMEREQGKKSEMVIKTGKTSEKNGIGVFVILDELMKTKNVDVIRHVIEL